MPTQLVIPSAEDFVKVEIPVLDTTTLDGNRIYVPEHTLYIATRYPRDEKGRLISGMTHKETAEYIRKCNEDEKISGILKQHGKDHRLKPITLYEDEAVRDFLGKEHTAYDENFQRNGADRAWGYFDDFTRPRGDKTTEGVDGQKLLLRTAYWRLSGGDVELGIVPIAPDGIIPLFTKKELEKKYGSDGLKILEKLGVKIPDGADEIVKPINELGYAQFTLPHDAKDKDVYIHHDTHNFRPEQGYGESVGVRDAVWHRHDERRCVDVDLSVDPESSYSRGSFPLVRGDVVKMKIEKPSHYIEF